MRTLWIAIVGTFATLSGGCADHPYDPDAPAIDPGAPVVHISSPARGAFAGDVQIVTVTGNAHDDVGVVQVEVNGVDAALAADGTWTARIPVAPGTQLIHAVARDAQGNVGKESRAVVTGPLQPIATAVPRAITVSMSAQTFDAVGRGVTGYLRTSDLAAVVAPYNPVIDVGGGPDCNYVQAQVTRISLGSATSVNVLPTSRGLALDAELDQVALGLHLAYSVLCFDGASDITVTADHVKVAGVVTLGVSAGVFDAALTGADVELSRVDVDLTGLPGDVVGWLDLDHVLGKVVSSLAEHFVAPALDSALGSLDHARTVDVLGIPVDIRLSPSRIAVDASGAEFEIDTSLRAQGDAGSPGFVAVANQQPGTSTDHGFSLAIADDAANQLLGSVWAAGGLSRAFDLTTGSYGNIGQLYDRVELSAKVPPFVSASGGSLVLTIGDLMATFKRGDAVATAIAVSAEVEIKVAAGADGKPRLDVGTPTTYVDVLDEHVAGANVLSNAQFEIIASFALSRVIAVGSGAIGAVPVPAFGGVAVRDLAIAEQTGYLVVDGNIQ
jgi:hypothetical protein